MQRFGEVYALNGRVQLDSGRGFREIDASVDGHVHEDADEFKLFDGTKQNDRIVTQLFLNVTSKYLQL
jgi:hypothetical protein